MKCGAFAPNIEKLESVANGLASVAVKLSKWEDLMSGILIGWLRERPAMSVYHDFKMGEVVVFKPKYVRAGDDPNQAYIIVNSHPESKLLDVKPVGWDSEKYPFAPIGTYSHHCFVRADGSGSF